MVYSLNVKLRERLTFELVVMFHRGHNGVKGSGQCESACSLRDMNKRNTCRVYYAYYKE